MLAIGQRIRQLREQKGLSQGDIQKSTGLLRCYTSRVENGHTVPSLETVERFAAALGVPLYQFFHMDENPTSSATLSTREKLEQLADTSGRQGSDARFLLRIKPYVDHMSESARELLLDLARKLAAG